MTWARNLQTEQRNLADGRVPGGQATAWDVVKFGDDRLVCPGIAKVSVTSSGALDVQKPKGGKKATITDQGDPPTSVSIQLRLQPDDLQVFADYVLPVLRPRSAKGARQPLRCEHPMLTVLGISDIIVDSVDLAHPEPGGLMVIKIKALEWLPAPKPVEKTKRKSKATKPDPLIEPSLFLTDPLYAATGEGERPVDPFLDIISNPAYGA